MKNTYLEHAKQMIALAEYKITDVSIIKPNDGEAVVFSLECLDTKDIEFGPEGEKYNTTESFVAVTKSGGSYNYYVTLREGSNGLELISYENLNKTTAINSVGEISGSYKSAGSVTGVGTIVYEC